MRWKSWCQTGILSEREDRRTRSHRGQEPVRVAKESPTDTDERSGGLEAVGQAEDKVATRWSPHDVLTGCGDRGAKKQEQVRLLLRSGPSAFGDGAAPGGRAQGRCGCLGLERRRSVGREESWKRQPLKAVNGPGTSDPRLTGTARRRQELEEKGKQDPGVGVVISEQTRGTQGQGSQSSRKNAWPGRGPENKGATVKHTGNAWHPEDPQRAHQEVVSLHTRQPARKPRREVDAPSGHGSQQRCVER